MYDFPQPGAEQERLKQMTGDWNSQVKFYFQPGTPPMERDGTYTAKLDLGGYFLDRQFKVELDSAADFTGLAFHGRGLTGYDPYKKNTSGSGLTRGVQLFTTPKQRLTGPANSTLKRRKVQIRRASQ